MRAHVACGALVALAAACAHSEASTSEQTQSSVESNEPCGGGDRAPDDIACTGLYVDVASKQLSPDARAFAPAVPLWSDGADKSRWIALPAGTTIDASSIDDWRFPVGTRAWKEFKVAGKRVETRFMQKVRDDRWVQASYVWSDDERTATRGDGRDIEVNGHPYHVPKSTECDDCHKGRVDRLLGFEALSLGQAGATGLTLAALAAEGRLDPPPASTSIAIPDDASGKSARALAWLHVNCGVSCHNDGAASSTARSTGLRMRLEIADFGARPISQWDAYKTTVGVDARTPSYAGRTRIVPGDPGASLLVELASLRGVGQMPPLGTDVVDADAIKSVVDWIASMPPRTGRERAPAPADTR